MKKWLFQNLEYQGKKYANKNKWSNFKYVTDLQKIVRK